MSYGRKCNKAYQDCVTEQGYINPCFWVYNGVCQRPKDISWCPMPKMSKKPKGEKK